MRRLLGLLALVTPQMGGVLLAVLLRAATVGSGVGLMAASAYLISAAALHPSIAALSVAIIGVRFFGLARGMMRYLERIVSHAASLRLVSRLRLWFYQAIESQAPPWLRSERSGDLLAVAASDLEGLQDLVARVLSPPGVALLVGMGTALYLRLFGASLAWLWIVSMTLAGIVLPLAAWLHSRKTSRRQVTLSGRLHGDLVEWVQGLADLVAFGAGKRWMERLYQVESDFVAAQRRFNWGMGLQTTAGSLLAHLSMAAILALGVALCRAGQLDGVYLGTLALAGLAAFEAFAPLPLAAQTLDGTLTAARRLVAVADAPPSVSEPAPATSFPAQPGGLSIEVEGLTFSYSADRRPALHGITFGVPPGGHVAIVGPSGAGKSTLVNLLLRLWDYDEGEIRINSAELRALAADDVRSRLAVVPQETYLFDGTVRENLPLARPTAREEELMEAARRAGADEFIEALPNGYDTWVGEHGLRLSGGERQRLAIARALLRDAPMFVLDEPTANLDSLTERRTIAALLNAGQGRTLLWITHRLVGLEAMDEILVMDRGQIVQRGRHVDLVGSDGVYRRLWRAQRRAWDVLVAEAS
ncbi:MAG: thiol reductant ABC exporter subunit CydC [Chloroflexota bacterium]